ncbi:MAG: hypothetical protein ABI988_04660, partial [Nitrospirota bacterium]
CYFVFGLVRLCHTTSTMSHVRAELMNTTVTLCPSVRPNAPSIQFIAAYSSRKQKGQTLMAPQKAACNFIDGWYIV